MGERTYSLEFGWESQGPTLVMARQFWPPKAFSALNFPRVN